MASLAARPAVVGLLAALAAPATASAEPYEVGAFFGPRYFASDSALGDHPDDDFRTALDTTVAFGGRAAQPVRPWLVGEAELPFAVATTRELDVSVYWFEPRAHARFLWPTREQIKPFAVLGVGIPLAVSSKRGLFASDVSLDGYGGIGAMFVPGRGLSFRADVRVGVTDGVEAPIAAEVEATIGLFIELEGGRPRRRAPAEVEEVVRDTDGDHILDPDDRCLERPEDEDGWDDDDGCPDIDNDADQVLDIADACPTVPESYNGFDDEDGCQDSVPGDLTAVLGTIEGLRYDTSSIDVSRKARRSLDRIARVLAKRPSVRVVVIGHTDDREVHLRRIKGESPPEKAQRLAAALVELSRDRAAAIRGELIERGVLDNRIDVVGKGGADPVSDNDRRRGRLRNRRVELQLYIPPRK